jgi:hypothetical protein
MFSRMFAFRTQSRRLRPLVWAMLFAWLFGLTAGVVNACALDLPSAPARNRVAESHTARPAHVGADTGHHVDGLTAQHEHEQNSRNDSCLKFCDDESSVLFKDNKAEQDQGVLLVAATLWPVAVVPVSSAGAEQSSARPSAQGPPLVIRFLRLTL